MDEGLYHMNNIEDQISRINQKASILFDSNLDQKVVLDICKDDMPTINFIIQSYNQTVIDNYCDRYTSFYRLLKIIRHLSK